MLPPSFCKSTQKRWSAENVDCWLRICRRISLKNKIDNSNNHSELILAFLNLDIWFHNKCSGNYLVVLVSLFKRQETRIYSATNLKFIYSVSGVTLNITLLLQTFCYRYLEPVSYIYFPFFQVHYHDHFDEVEVAFRRKTFSDMDNLGHANVWVLLKPRKSAWVVSLCFRG